MLSSFSFVSQPRSQDFFPFLNLGRRASPNLKKGKSPGNEVVCFVEKSPETGTGLFSLTENHPISFS